MILATRYIAAIREKHPNSSITAYLDTNGSKFQEELYTLCYSHLINKCITIPNKKEEKYVMTSPFGREEYPAHLRNIPDKYIEEMLDADRFYDLCGDTLAFLSADFDWFKYYRFFPRPQVKESIEKPFNRYIVCNLYTDANNSHGMDENYVKTLLQSIQGGMPIVCIVNPVTKPFYEKIINESDRCKFFEGNWGQIASLVEQSVGMIAVDSGASYLAYAYSIPVLVYTKYSHQPHSIMFSHKLRWRVFENDCIPPNFDLQYSLAYFAKTINSKVFWINPGVQNLTQEIVDRFGYAIERR
jgi:ADP-heptose:LPS heptosyltransferase